MLTLLGWLLLLIFAAPIALFAGLIYLLYLALVSPVTWAIIGAMIVFGLLSSLLGSLGSKSGPLDGHTWAVRNGHMVPIETRDGHRLTDDEIDQLIGRDWRKPVVLIGPSGS